MITDILVIDDERTFLTIFREWAKLSGMQVNVLTTDSGKKALEMLQTIEVDLIMTDLRMPEMDGHELLRAVKQRYSRIPVIIMTADGTPDMERKLRDSGAAKCLEKPLDLNTIMKTFRDVQMTAKAS